MEYEPCLQDGKRLPFTETYGPDGVEAWLVAIAALYINFIMAGIGRVSGILFIAFIESCGVGRSLASLPISVRSSIRSLFGPIVGILGQKYGPRPVMILGGIISTLSSAACFFLDDIYWITAMWGVVSGIGAALSTTLPQVLIGQHFKKYRTTASGMSFSGGCVGSFFFPYLIEYVLYEYALGGTFLIISGIMMNVIPASFMLKSPSWLENKKKRVIKIISGTSSPEKNHPVKFDSSNAVKERNGDCEKCLLPSNEFSVSEANNKSNDKCRDYTSNAEKILNSKIDTEFLLENADIVVQLLTNNFNLQNNQIGANESSNFPVDDALIEEIELLFSKIEENHSKNNAFFCDCNFPALKSEPELEDNCKHSNEKNSVNDDNKSNDFLPKNLKSIDFVSLSLENLFQNDRKQILKNFSEKQHEVINRVLEDMWQLHELLSTYNTSPFPADSFLQNSMYLEGSFSNLKIEDEKSNTFYSHIKTALEVHKKPIFILICLCRSVHFLTFLPMVTIVVDFAKDRGFLTEEGTLIINVLSLGDLTGRLCFGWVTDKGFVTLPRYMLFIMILQGITAILLPLMQTRSTIMFFIFAFGLLQGSVFVRHPVLVSRYLKSHEQSIAMGCMDFFSGLIGFTIPVYIGYFRDTIGAYDGIFYVNGSIGVFIGFLWLFEPYLLKMTTKPHLNDDKV